MFFCLEKKILHFKQPAGTSRGVYTTRKIWLVHLTDGERTGMGECAPLPDLSCDARKAISMSMPFALTLRCCSDWRRRC